jgi:hypothetical protein
LEHAFEVHTSRDNIHRGYYYVRNNTGDSLVFQNYITDSWLTIASTTSARTTNTDYYIFDINSNDLKGYVSTEYYLIKVVLGLKYKISNMILHNNVYISREDILYINYDIE